MLFTPARPTSRPAAPEPTRRVARRTSAAGVVAAVLAVSLTACGSSGTSTANAANTAASSTSPASSSSSSSAASPSGSGSAAPTAATVSPQPPTASSISGVTVKGSYGDKPTITTSGSAPGQLKDALLKQGNGPVVKSGDLLVTNYLGQIWGGKVFDNSWDRSQYAAFPIGTGKVIPGWDAALVGVKTGSRVLISIPPSMGYGSSGQSQAGIKGTDTLVFVVDVVAAYGPQASAGADAAPQKLPSGYPTVKGAPPAEPTIEIPASATTPKDINVQLVDKGTGKMVTDGPVVVQYKIQGWDGKTYDNTWQKGGPQWETMSGHTGSGSIWDMLRGYPVGSRVLVEIPAQQAQASNPAEPAAAVVIDILGQNLFPAASSSAGASGSPASASSTAGSSTAGSSTAASSS